MRKAGVPINILLVEDSPGDVRLMRENLKDFMLFNELSVVNDGTLALRYLRQKEPFVGAVPPDLIILDLNLPRMNGREVLAETKKDPSLKQTPVIILTSSEADLDIMKVYDLKANCYITKPCQAAEFLRAIQSIGCFGLSIVKLPPA